MMTNGVLCRLCALECKNYVNIYENSENSSMELHTKIASCLQIWVTKEDILPKTVCQFCFTKLSESFEFFQISNKAQFLLREIYQLDEESCRATQAEADNGANKFQVDNSQYEQAANHCNEASKIEEDTQIREAGLSDLDNQLIQPDLVDLVFEIPVDQSIDLSPAFEPDNVDSYDEDTDSVLEIKKRSHRRKKDPNLNDVPANPRLTQILEGYPWSCTLCDDTVLASIQDLRDHYKVEHQKPPIFKCVNCDKQYDRYRSFSRHVKLHKNPKRYTCDICGKSFSQKTTLRSHATVHTSDRPHSCMTCGKAFKNFSSLYVHGRMHLPDQAKEKYRCDLCKKEFSTRHTLETHRKIHTGERNFVCDICGKSFIAKGSLDYHLLSHTGDKNHVCSTCGKGFKTARLLSKHASLHSGIKPHQCDVCGKQFRERGALREHSRIHTGAMPYSCEFCGKCFRFKGILTVHRRQHTGERPYACLECRRYFTNWANYNKHMKRIHRYDTSNPCNSRLRSNVNNESTKSLVTENKTSRYSISSVDTIEIFPPSTQPLADVSGS